MRDQLFLISAQKIRNIRLKNNCWPELDPTLVFHWDCPWEIIFINDMSNWGPITVVVKGVKIALGRSCV